MLACTILTVTPLRPVVERYEGMQESFLHIGATPAVVGVQGMDEAGVVGKLFLFRFPHT
ncbi:MAG: hypothetical protein ACK5PQ_02425 [Alphaproteobacteria bacterium]